MRKEHVLSILILLLSIALTSKVVFALYETTYPWLIYRHDPARSGYAPVSVPNTNTTLWKLSGPYYAVTPIIAEGIVYAAAYDDLYAVDETTGAELWTVDVNPTDYYIYGGPTFADGRLYVGTNEGYLYCLNATNGQQIWYWPTGSLPGAIETSPAVANGKVYFGTADYSSPSVKNYLVAVNVATGVEIWRYSGAGDKILSSPAIDGTWIFFGSDDDKLYALNDTGSSCQVKWTFATGGDVRSTPCVSGNKVIFGTSSTDHSIFAFDKMTGDTIWQYTLSSSQSIENSVALANDVVYFAPYSYSTYSSKAYALNASAPAGTYTEDVNDDDILLWRTPQFDTYLLTSPVATDEKVLFASNQVLYALSTANGVELWRYRFEYTGTSEPVIADGRIFINQRYDLYCFGDSYPPNTYHYPVSVLGHDFVVKITANATSNDFDYSDLLSDMKITYTLEANWIDDITAMSEITIPNQMLGGPYTLKVDGASPSTRTDTNNGTHTTIHFTYLHLSHDTHTIEITGATVIPEFPSTIILTSLIISLIAATLAKKRLHYKLASSS